MRKIYLTFGSAQGKAHKHHMEICLHDMVLWMSYVKGEGKLIACSIEMTKIFAMGY